MNTITLLQATEKTNGIIVKQTGNNINSVELRKVSISNRDNGYICSLNKSGDIFVTGSSWRKPTVNSPLSHEEMKELIYEKFPMIQQTFFK